MKSREAHQARRLEACMNEMLRQRRRDEPGVEPPSSQDLEFQRLRDIVQMLGEFDVVPPDGFRDALLQRLQQAPADELLAQPSQPPSLFRSVRAIPGALVARMPGTPLRTAALAAAVLIAVAVLSRSLFDASVVSAQSILTRSDEALIDLVRPGQYLYRQWRVTTTSTAPSPLDATRGPRSGRIIEEWMDGSDFDRVASRWYSDTHELQVAYSTQLQDGEHRPYVYFSPGVYDEKRGVLNIEPTRREYDAALAAFPESSRRGLQVYLDRHYIYAPIIGERAFNRAMVEAPAHHVPEMPRILTSFDHSHVLDTTPVYRVSVLDSASVTFNWRSSGPPLIRLARADIVRYIARDSFLSLRTEEQFLFEDGRRRFTTRELVTTKAVDPATLERDPFVIDVPPGTPTQRQSASEQLAGVADILRRVPAFTARVGGDDAATASPAR
jgi:hypothetical protein